MATKILFYYSTKPLFDIFLASFFLQFQFVVFPSSAGTNVEFCLILINLNEVALL